MPFGWLNSMAHLRLAHAQPRNEPAKHRQRDVIDNLGYLGQPLERRIEVVDSNLAAQDRMADDPRDRRGGRDQAEPDQQHGADRLDVMQFPKPRAAQEEEALHDEVMR